MVRAADSSVSGLRAAMTFHHARLETSGRHVIATLHLEGQAAAATSFRVFLRVLEAHLQAEETWVLPPFARVRPLACEGIRAEHERIRRAAEAAASAFERQMVDERVLLELLALLDEHCRGETSDLYRWSETAIGEQESRAVLQKIEAAELGKE